MTTAITNRRTHKVTAPVAAGSPEMRERTLRDELFKATGLRFSWDIHGLREGTEIVVTLNVGGACFTGRDLIAVGEAVLRAEEEVRRERREAQKRLARRRGQEEMGARGARTGSR